MIRLQMIAKPRKVKLGALAFLAATALGVAPALTGGSLGGDQAFAHPGNGNGGGNGNGNGNGGGNGNGDGGGNGHAAVGAGAGVGASDGSSSHGAVSSALGALNAAHASKTALAHANPHSRVGRIAAYSKAVQAAEQSVATAKAQLAADQAAMASPATIAQDRATLAAAQTALARTEFTFARAAANKSVTPAVISALNSLLGIR